MRLHPLHSRLCASVAPVAAQLDPADSLRQAASACLSPAATQMLWATSVTKGSMSTLAPLAFHLAHLGGGVPGEGGSSATHVVTVSAMDMRGRMEQIAFAVKTAASPVEGGAAARQPEVKAAR